MSNSFKKRFIKALGAAIYHFIVCLILYRFIIFITDWLYYSIIWSISWAMGLFISECIATLNKPLRFNIIIDTLIILTLLLFLMSSLSVFIFFKFITWKLIIIIVFSFSLSIIINQIISFYSNESVSSK